MIRKADFKVDEKFSGMTVKAYLRNYIGASAAVLSQLKRTENGITVNGKPVFVNVALNSGDVLSVIFDDEDEENPDVVAVKGEFDIVYEDDDLLVVDKPPYLPVHPSKGHPNDTLANYIVNYYAEKNESFVFRCVNRLDGNTSGLVVIAKNAFTHFALRQQAEKGLFCKTYYAIVHGKLAESGKIDAPIARADGATIKRIVSPDGLRAVTRYRAIIRGESLSFAELRLETGRTHQIRVHMAYIGHPLAGDFLYGDENDGVMKRQALHLGQIELIQPISGEKLIFESKNNELGEIINRRI